MQLRPGWSPIWELVSAGGAYSVYPQSRYMIDYSDRTMPSNR